MASTREVSSRVGASYEIPGSEKEKIEESSEDRVGLLPNELAVTVFSILDPHDLATCSKVCRRWKELADADILWKEFIEDKEIKISGKSVKEYIKAQYPGPGAIFCRSYDEAMLGLEDFFRNIPDGQMGRFRVILSQSNEEVTFSYGIVDTKVDKTSLSDRDPDFIKTCFLIHSKIDVGVIYSGDNSLAYAMFSSDNRSLERYESCKYIFYRSDIKARMKKSFKKFHEIANENAEKCRNEESKPISRFSYRREYLHYIIAAAGALCITNLVSYFINNNQ